MTVGLPRFARNDVIFARRPGLFSLQFEGSVIQFVA